MREGPEFQNNFQRLLQTIGGATAIAPSQSEWSLSRTFLRNEASAEVTRKLPEARTYIFISDNKINELFGQLPSSYINSFTDAADNKSIFFKVGVLSTYIREVLDVVQQLHRFRISRDH